MTVNQRDIFLVPIPFSDLSAKKRRPVLIISNDGYNRAQSDCLVMAITSQVNRENPQGVVFSDADLEEGRLPKMSQIRSDKVYSLHQKLLIRRFGKLSGKIYDEAASCLKRLIQKPQE